MASQYREPSDGAPSAPAQGGRFARTARAGGRAPRSARALASHGVSAGGFRRRPRQGGLTRSDAEGAPRPPCVGGGRGPAVFRRAGSRRRARRRFCAWDHPRWICPGRPPILGAAHGLALALGGAAGAWPAAGSRADRPARGRGRAGEENPLAGRVLLVQDEESAREDRNAPLRAGPGHCTGSTPPGSSWLRARDAARGRSWAPEQPALPRASPPSVGRAAPAPARPTTPPAFAAGMVLRPRGEGAGVRRGAGRRRSRDDRAQSSPGRRGRAGDPSFASSPRKNPLDRIRRAEPFPGSAGEPRRGRPPPPRLARSSSTPLTAAAARPSSTWSGAMTTAPFRVTPAPAKRYLALVSADARPPTGPAKRRKGGGRRPLHSTALLAFFRPARTEGAPRHRVAKERGALRLAALRQVI